jgi:hypothetical protein
MSQEVVHDDLQRVRGEFVPDPGRSESARNFLRRVDRDGAEAGRSTSGTLVVHAATRDGKVGHDARQALLGHREGIPGQHHEISPLTRLDGPLLALLGGRVCGEAKRNYIVPSDGNCITGAALSINGSLLM